ncbi:MAG: zinc ABC transporter substrate-binding protein, partial [Bacillota bacterium]|nr:zinc ABC transporter substrate-binding protein [Bacillota bacterium]
SIPRHHYLNLIAKASDSVRARLQAASPQSSSDISMAVQEVALRASRAASGTSDEPEIARGLIKSLYDDGRLVKIENEIDFIEGVVHHHDEEEPETTTTEPEAPTTLGYDPHFWVSPERMLLVNDVLLAKLLAAYPDHAAQITANHATLETNLTELSAAYQAAIDAGTKFMMTSTNLYGYLTADYGIESISISPGYHEETEQFTAQHKQEIVDDAILRGVRYIIYEKNASSPLSEAVIATLNQSGLDYVVGKLDFNIMDTVPSDGSTYIQIMYLNLQSIVTATALIIDVNAAR